MSEADVAVVGAGPAGSACASALAQEGFTVALVDQHAFPRDKPCGDGLSPTGVEALRRIGLTSLLNECQQIAGLRMILDHRRERLTRFRQPGACAPRAVLDKALLDIAIASGVEFVKGRALGLGADSSVRFIEDGKKEALKAGRIVAADGPTSVMRRSAGLGSPGHVVRAWAIRGYYSVERPLEELFDFYLPLEVKGTITVGYGWLFPVGPHTANIGVGFLRPRGFGRLPRLNEALDAFVEELRLREERRYGEIESRGRSIGSPLGFNFNPGQCSDGHMLLVGDAAGVTDSLTGEGIGHALISGETGSRWIARSLRGSSSLAGYGVELGRRMPRVGQNFSFISCMIPASSSTGEFTSNRIRDCEFMRSAGRMVTESQSPDEESVRGRTIVRLGKADREEFGVCVAAVQDALRTTFPFTTSTLLKRMHGLAGPLISTVLVCTARTFDISQPQKLSDAAVATECLTPLAGLIGEVDDDRGGRAAAMNNGLAILSADFAISCALRAAAQIGPGAVARFANVVQQICEGGMIDSADRYNLERSEDRVLRALELRVGSVFGLAAALGTEISDRSEEDVLRISRFGSELGVAYGLAQAMAEITAAETDTSTIIANLRQGIYSLPILVAAKEDPRVRKAIVRGIEKDEVGDLISLLRTSDGLKSMLVHLVARVERARETISGENPSRNVQLLSLLDQVTAGNVDGFRLASNR